MSVVLQRQHNMQHNMVIGESMTRLESVAADMLLASAFLSYICMPS